ncbi:MAG TPA: hypothetical protein EYQ34_05560 [Acidimicrobiia bacterium]|nr:hypothetical protein [Acidimicrobiia bacterium]
MANRIPCYLQPGVEIFQRDAVRPLLIGFLIDAAVCQCLTAQHQKRQYSNTQYEQYFTDVFGWHDDQGKKI